MLVTWMRKQLRGWRAPALLGLLVALIWLAARGLPDGRLHVYFLDVGQGDAIFVVTPDGRQVLVDGGPSPAAVLGQLAAVMPFWDRTLDLVVLTHPDTDHQAGLLAVLDRYEVAQLLQTEDARFSGASEAWQARLDGGNIKVEQPVRGARVVVGDSVLSILNPGPRPLRGTEADDNNNSLVIRLDYGQASFLLTGDAESEAEAALLASGVPLAAQVLKVGHHGSERSSGPPFLAAVTPRLAVIQVGTDNRFGHPSAETLSRLRGTRVLRTDQSGRIEVISDGRKLWVTTEK